MCKKYSCYISHLNNGSDHLDIPDESGTADKDARIGIDSVHKVIMVSYLGCRYHSKHIFFYVTRNLKFERFCKDSTVFG